MKIQLSISLLVSDRADTLKKCLNSLKGLLRELPCELIVVFTGEKEETLEIIKEYTEHIIPFRWCDDFSAARNVGLQAAKGEWFLYLDDDEWFEDTTELIQFFKSGEYQRYQSAAYIQRNYADFGGMNYGDSYVDRLVRRTADVRFVSSIHERFELEGGLQPQKYIHEFVHHYGYVRAAGANKKNDMRVKRNLPLLLNEFQNNPDDGKNCAQIAQEYKNIPDFEKAEYYARKGLEAYAKNKTVYTPEYWMMAYLPQFILRQGDKKRALAEAESLLQNPRRCELAELYLYKTIIYLAKELHQPEKGIGAVIDFHNTLKYLEAHPEVWERQGAGDIVFPSLQKEVYQVYADALACAAQLENFEAMSDILQMIPWDEDAEMSAQFYILLDEWKDDYSGQTEEILNCFSQIKSKNPYIIFQKALYAEKQGVVEDIEACYGKCVENAEETMQKELIKFALRNRLEVSKLLVDMSLERWNELVPEIAAEISVRTYEENEKAWKECFKNYPLYYLALEQQFFINVMLEKVLEGEELIVVLKKFCESAIGYSRQVYSEKILGKEQKHELPEVYQFAFIMEEVIAAIEENQADKAIKLLKNALKVCPRLRILVKRTMNYIVGMSEKASVPQNPEFAMLGGQIKQMVKGLLANGQFREAESVLGQLTMLLPDDMEVLKMKQILMQHLG